MTPVEIRPGTAARQGALRFGLASLLVFTTVAFAKPWMFENLGGFGAYLTWVVLFILLGGVALRPIAGWTRTRGFLPRFAAAFLAYAVGWIGSYATLQGDLGEWVGAVAAPLSMAVAFCASRTAWSLFPRLALTLFVAHVVGYFGGEPLYRSIDAPFGMLLWGVVYGLSLGAGLGVALAGLDRTGRASAV